MTHIENNVRHVFVSSGVQIEFLNFETQNSKLSDEWTNTMKLEKYKTRSMTRTTRGHNTEKRGDFDDLNVIELEIKSREPKSIENKKDTGRSLRRAKKFDSPT
jgi:hypothetical protein